MTHGDERAARGPIAYMAGNGVAANLLMLFIVAAGVVSLGGLVQEVFPEVSLDQVQVSVNYPGATPDEVEESIILQIEEHIRGVEGVDQITATASEGRASVVAELELGTDVSQALNEIKAEVDRIQSFPAGAERPEVREATNRQSVIQLAVFGDVSERALKETAYRIEDALAALPSVSYVETTAVRDYEISIEVPLRRLRALGLTIDQVAAAVRSGSLELSAGSIENADQAIRIRTVGQNYDQQDFEEIIVLARPDGTVVRLGEIADVRDGFQEAELITRYRGQRAAFVEVYRTSDERVLEIADAVEAHLAAEILPSLPAGVGIEVWNNDAELLRDRLRLLLKNALLGLALVLAALAVFLEARLALWVAAGIAVSFVGTFAVMLATGTSVNMVSMFAFILAVGIVVDDAIVVCENIYAEREKGAHGLQAAIRGTLRIKRPVIFAVLTTVAAFAPLLFIPGVVGKLLRAIPVIAISVLAISLLESLLVLPNHLSKSKRRSGGPDPARRAAPANVLRRVRALVNDALARFTDGPLDRALRLATGRPTIVIAVGIGMIVLCVATVPAGIINLRFFPEVEADAVHAAIEMPEGTPAARTNEATLQIEAAGHRTIERLSEGRPADAAPLLAGVNVTVGRRARQPDPFGGSADNRLRANIGSVAFKLLEAEERDVAAADFLQEWRRETGFLPQARSLTFAADLLNLGPPVQAELSHPDPAGLADAGRALADELRQLAGVFDIKTDQDQGFTEIQIELRPEARTLGLTLEDLARQVRAAFFGTEALRVQRGREDVRVYVRLPEEERNAIADVERYQIRTPLGAEVPLGRVASLRLDTSPSAIRRKDARRVLTVTADIDPATATNQQVTGHLSGVVLPALAEQHAGLDYAFGGEQQEQAESFAALGRGFILALLIIYALLAIPFRSYTKPVIVMAAIPFGIIGAVLGHLLLGLDMSALSMFGIIGLSGVVVNDSLVMIDFVDERLKQGMSGREAIITGAKARFRPILLTSLTTFLGVSPLVFEQNLQAQFLVPMAASLGFGIIFATVVLMMIVPALAMLHHDAEEWRRA